LPSNFDWSRTKNLISFDGLLAYLDSWLVTDFKLLMLLELFLMVVHLLTESMLLANRRKQGQHVSGTP
jgi:hypothetical protein